MKRRLYLETDNYPELIPVEFVEGELVPVGNGNRILNMITKIPKKWSSLIFDAMERPDFTFMTFHECNNPNGAYSDIDIHYTGLGNAYAITVFNSNMIEEILREYPVR